MPIKHASEKHLRATERRTARNLARKHAFRAAIRNFRHAVASQKWDEARKLLSQSFKALDKAAGRKVIKKNTASRKKSRLSILLAKAQRKPAAP